MLSRLLCSTLWPSKSSGHGIWSCCQEEDSKRNSILYEAESHLETAQYYYHKNDLVAAYEKLAVASIIGNNYDVNKRIVTQDVVEQNTFGNVKNLAWGKCFEVIPAMLRMRCSLAGKRYRDILKTLL